MMIKIKRAIPILFSILIIIVSGCASSYKQIVVSNQKFIFNQTIDSNLVIGYTYDFYSKIDNNKYYYLSNEYGYKTLCIVLTNISSDSIQITRENFKAYNDDMQIEFLTSKEYLRDVRQPSYLYLLHGLWGLLAAYATPDIYEDYKPGFILAGSLFAVSNTFTSIEANKMHKNNLMENEIFGKSIPPRVKLYGVLILKSDTYDKLTFRFSKK